MSSVCGRVATSLKHSTHFFASPRPPDVLPHGALVVDRLGAFTRSGTAVYVLQPWPRSLLVAVRVAWRMACVTMCCRPHQRVEAQHDVLFRVSWRRDALRGGAVPPRDNLARTAKHKIPPLRCHEGQTEGVTCKLQNWHADRMDCDHFFRVVTADVVLKKRKMQFASSW